MNFIGGYRPHQMQVVTFGSGTGLKKIIRRRPNNPGSIRCHFGLHDFDVATDFHTKEATSLVLICSRCPAVYDMELEKAFYPDNVSDYELPRPTPPVKPVKRPMTDDQASLTDLITELNYSVRELTAELARSRAENKCDGKMVSPGEE